MFSRKTLLPGLLGFTVGLIGIGCCHPEHRRLFGRFRQSPSAESAVANPTPMVPPPPVPAPSGPVPPAPAPAATAAPAPPAVAPPPAPESATSAARIPDPPPPPPADLPPPGAADVAGAASPSTARGTPPGPRSDLDRIREMQQRAAERFAGIDAYAAHLRRREQIGGKDKPEEVMLFKFRKQPWSVYFKWIGPEGHGREVVYVLGRYDNKLHNRLAAGDIPFMPGGFRIALAPNDPRVLSSSRHLITEAGIGVVIEQLGKLVVALEHGDTRYRASYRGLVQRPEFEAPLEVVEVDLAPGLDPTLPRGGHRLCGIDPASQLPVLIITWNETRHEVEYYCYSHLQYPVQLSDDDFNPDKLWRR